MKKLLFVTPHLSTGGLPQYLLKKIELLKNEFKIYVIEFQNIAPIYDVQRNAIKDLVGSRFYSIESRQNRILEIIRDVKPDIVHFEEFAETMFSSDVLEKVWEKNRKHFIVETTHNSVDQSNIKRFIPDKFMLVSQLNYDQYKEMKTDIEIVEYELEKKRRPNREKALKELDLDPNDKHILCVGLFTPGKNQGEVFEIAKEFDENVKFHFVGNMAGNFENYWKPLIENTPNNCVIWGERNDVEIFYSSMDMLIFPSLSENNPLVIKEALAWDMPILLKDLPAYGGKFEGDSRIHFMKDVQTDKETIKFILNLDIVPQEMSKFGEIKEASKTPVDKNIKCFITHTTENYFDTTRGLIDSLLEFSNKDIYVFTVNFQSKVYLFEPRVHMIPFSTNREIVDPKFFEEDGNKYIDRSDDSIYNILTLKPHTMLKAFKIGITSGVYLDGDMIARSNVDDLFENEKDIDNYPLVTRGVFEQVFHGGKDKIEEPLMKYLGVKKRSMFYVQTNTIVFNTKCKEFIEEWRDTVDDDYIRNDWRNLAPYHEETIINVLFWKYGYTKRLNLSFINVKNSEFIEEFLRWDDTDKSKYIDSMKAFPFYVNGEKEHWTWLPYEKDWVKVFHGMKDYNEIKKSIELLKTEKLLKCDETLDARSPYIPLMITPPLVKNKICIVMTHDDAYSEIASHTVKKNKEYAEKNNYDFKVFTKIIDDRWPPYWQKFLGIEKVLDNYDWVFYIDSDSMIMNHSIKLESLIDEDYDIIMPHTKYTADKNSQWEKYDNPDYYCITSHMLIKNSEISKGFIQSVLDNHYKVPWDKFDFDNRIARILISDVDAYRKVTKIVNETDMQSIWPVNKPKILLEQFPTWNTNSNIYKPGDFSVHVVGYDLEDRAKILKQLKNYVQQ